ncbi:MAG: glycosyltransferase family 1 protein [Chloroflexota bacterium]|nr:MAG: glycosyltransferase family 1 protein [Chloroflexota bacterium]
MKICLIANPNSIHTKRWVDEFTDKGYELHLVGDHTPTSHVSPKVKFYDLTRILNIRKIRYLVWPVLVRRLVQAIQPNLLHAFGVASSGWLGAGANFHPFMVTAHGSDLLLFNQRSWLYQRSTRFALRKADYLICVSKGLAEKARQLGVDNDRIEVVYLGVDTRVFHPASDPEAVRQRLGFTAGPKILSIRAMNDTYRPLDIARSIPGVCKQFPMAQFVIFTYNQDVEIFRQFKTIIHEQQVEQAVRYVDRLADDYTIAQYYQACDLAISVPESDGTPISVLEAMACGKAVIASDLPTLLDWASDGQEAIFVPVGDVEAIEKAIVQLLGDSELRERMGQNALKVVSQRADRRIWMKRSEEIYHQLAR